MKRCKFANRIGIPTGTEFSCGLTVKPQIVGIDYATPCEGLEEDKEQCPLWNKK